MNNSKREKYRSHWHCVYNLKYHLVFVTKYRKKCFTKTILKRLENIFTEQCLKWDARLLEFGGEQDHVHLMIELHPNIMPSKLVNSLKTVSSRLIRKEFSEHMKKYYWKPTLWTRAYCLLTAGGAPLSILKKYIQKQKTPET